MPSSTTLLIGPLAPHDTVDAVPPFCHEKRRERASATAWASFVGRSPICNVRMTDIA